MVLKHEVIQKTAENNVLDENKLWRRLKNDDISALEEMFKTYYNLLFGYAIKINNDPQLIKDCIQELFSDLWGSRKNLGDVISIKGYLLKSIRRRVLKALKASRRLLSNSDGLYDEITFSHEDFIVKNESDEQYKRQLILAIEKLSKRQKEIIFLKYYEEMSYDEISDIMGIKYQSLRNTLHQALIELRKYMNF